MTLYNFIWGGGIEGLGILFIILISPYYLYKAWKEKKAEVEFWKSKAEYRESLRIKES